MNKNEFQKGCLEVVERLKSDSEFKKIYLSDSDGNPNAGSQYEDVVYWYRVMFSDSFEKNNKKIIGFHIMPYQITREDINKAVAQKNNIKNFNNLIKEDKSYVDYDNTSGNFHKVIENRIQIAFIDKNTVGHYGVGVPSKKINFTKNQREKYADRLKNDKVYYPNIDDNTTNITFDNLEKEIINALKYVGIIK